VKMKSYRVSDIDEGIRRSLKSSLNWLDSACLLLSSNKKDQAFIHYTFAVEEFGKALLLNDRKKDAIKKDWKMISNDDITFRNHDVKIKRAEAELKDPTIGISLIDISKIPELDLSQDIAEQIPQFTDVREFPSKGKFLSFENRMSLMYVDYDTNKLEWKEVDYFIPAVTMEVAFDAFKKEVEDWQSDFGKGLK
jgi:AbiV family abortive infection protein